MSSAFAGSGISRACPGRNLKVESGIASTEAKGVFVVCDVAKETREGARRKRWLTSQDTGSDSIYGLRQSRSRRDTPPEPHPATPVVTAHWFNVSRLRRFPPSNPSPPLSYISPMLLIKIHGRIRQPNILRTTLRNNQPSDLMPHPLRNPICNPRYPQNKICNRIHIQQQHFPNLAVDFGFIVWSGGGAADGESSDGGFDRCRRESFLEIDENVGFFGGGDVVDVRRVIVVDGGSGVELQSAGEAEAAYCAAVAFSALARRGSVWGFIETDAWCDSAAGEDGVVVGFVVELLVVEIVWDAGAEVGEALRAEPAAHVDEDIDVCAQ